MFLYSKFMSATSDEKVTFLLLSCKVLKEFTFTIGCKLIRFCAGCDEYAGFSHLIVYDTLHHKCIFDDMYVRDEKLKETFEEIFKAV